MKATLEFNLPEDKEDFYHSTKVNNYLSALHDIGDYLREITKYPNKEYTAEESIIIDSIRSRFYQILSDNGADLS